MLMKLDKLPLPIIVEDTMVTTGLIIVLQGTRVP